MAIRRLNLALPKPVRWVASSKHDVSVFPEDVRRRIGGALWDAQTGAKTPYAKPLKGFGGAGVLEIIDDFEGDTYRAVYTVRFAQKGIATPKSELDLIAGRLRQAQEDCERWIGSGAAKPT
jgi:phage-related protein